jgi:hypothetical protein
MRMVGLYGKTRKKDRFSEGFEGVFSALHDLTEKKRPPHRVAAF